MPHKTPSQKYDEKKQEEANKEQEAKKDKAENPDKLLRQAYARVAKSADGILVFRDLMDRSGYRKSSIVGNPHTGEIQDRGTLYNEARRVFYLETRAMIPPKTRAVIEQEQ